MFAGGVFTAADGIGGPDRVTASQQASVRAEVEHPYLIVKRDFWFTKTRHRGLAKNRIHLEEPHPSALSVRVGELVDASAFCRLDRMTPGGQLARNPRTGTKPGPRDLKTGQSLMTQVISVPLVSKPPLGQRFLSTTVGPVNYAWWPNGFSVNGHAYTCILRHVFPKGRVLTHRGLWSSPDDQNEPESLAGALAEGWGIETDVRDFGGQLVISHDPPRGDEPRLGEEACRWAQIPSAETVALNIKADGLADALALEFNKVKASLDVFFFDMSAPQTISFIERGLPIASRLSEIEPLSLGVTGFASEPRIVWLDCFRTDWFLGDSTVSEAVESSRTYLVSPEIHGRDPRVAWDWVAELRQRGHDVGICTDRPVDFLEHVS